MTKRPSSRVAMAALPLLLLASAAFTGSPMAAVERPGCASVRTTEGWRSIALPLDATGYAVLDSGTILVGGDDRVMSSVDGGCSWTTATTLDGPASIVGEGTVALAAAGAVVYAAFPGPSVLVSRDEGRTWTRDDAGLPPTGTVAGIYAGAGGVVYLVVAHTVTDEMLDAAGVGQTGTSVATTTLFRRSAGGSGWTAAGTPGVAWTTPAADAEGVLAPGAFWDLAVDPGDPDHLLAAVKGGVQRSADGGRTWVPAASDPLAEVRTVSVHASGSAASAVAVDPATGVVYEWPDVRAGTWFRHRHAALRTEHMATYPNAHAWAWSAFDARSGAAYVSGPKGVFRVEAGELVDLTPRGLGSTDAPADLSYAGGTIWARLLDGSALLALESAVPAASGSDGSVAAPGTPGDLPRPGLTARPVVRPGEVRLTPARTEVALEPGESALVPYRVRTSPLPGRADVYFLLDATASMTDTIRALTRGMGPLVERLARSGISIRAGAATFRTYPRAVEREDVDYAYRRVRALGPVDDELVERLYGVEGAGASGANLAAVYQAVTGAGQDVLPPGESNADIPPGLEAGFDPVRRKLIVHVADTWFGTPERGDPNGYYAPGTWPGPGFGAVTGVLAGAGVEHLGVAVRPSGGGTLLATADVGRDLRTLSAAAGSLAGARGADCDGDGRTDVAPGQPLVCPLTRGTSGSDLLPVVAGLIEAVDDPGSIALEELRDSSLVRDIAPGGYEVDLRAPADVTFSVRVECARADAGTTSVARLGAVVRGEVLASARLSIACGPGDLPRPPSLGPQPLVPVLPVPPPPPPPPHSVPGAEVGPALAPGPAQAPAPAQAPGGQPQATVVQQRQEQPQVALVQAARTVREQMRMEHAMVRATGVAPELGPVTVAAAATALAFVLAWGLATTSVARAASRRRGPR